MQLTLARLVGRVLGALPGTSLTIGPPRRVSPTLRVYIADRDGRDTSYIELHAETTIARSPPNMAKGAPPPGFLAAMTVRSPSAGVARISQGRVLTSTGAVIGPDDVLIADVSDTFLTDDIRANVHLAAPKLPRVTRCSQSIGVLSTYRSDIYYHWLLDTLPRLHLLREAGVSAERIVVPQRLAFQRESIALLGLQPTDLISESGLHLQASQLLVPTLPGRPGNPPLWACQFLRESFLAVPSPRPSTRSRIFISRQRTATRSLTNEDELMGILEGYGFERVFLEGLPFAAQVERFQQAAIVMAGHGSGLANLVFCNPGTQVIELFSAGYVNVMYWALSGQLALEYGCIIGSSGATPMAHRGRVHEDMEVNLVEVEAMLRRLLPGG